jgi:ribosomal protein S2
MFNSTFTLLNKYKLGTTTYGRLISCGFQLGGNTMVGFLRGTSVVYGIKNKNYVIKVSLTGLQLKKSIKIIYRYLKRKSTFYFVHSHFGFRLLMKQLHRKTNVLYLTFHRFVKSSSNKSKVYELFSGFMKKIYFISNWKPGLVTNRLGFFDMRKKKKISIKFPKYGFVNDYKINFICVKEFKNVRVPFSSLINLNASNTFFGFFDIPGNGTSYDTFTLI